MAGDGMCYKDTRPHMHMAMMGEEEGAARFVGRILVMEKEVVICQVESRVIVNYFSKTLIIWLLGKGASDDGCHSNERRMVMEKGMMA